MSAPAADRDAFVALMRRYNQRMFRVARAILPDDAEAEDAAQEAWVQAWRHLDQFEGRSDVGAWLARIASREALARARRRQLVLVDDIEENAMNAPDPERSASSAEARVLLERAIDGLAEPFRAVFVLRAVEEMSVAETAEVLGIPEETVKTRLHRARRQLHAALGRELDAAAPDAFAFASERCDRIIAGVLSRIASETGFRAPGE